jgi:hypothetical protein
MMLSTATTEKRVRNFQSPFFQVARAREAAKATQPLQRRLRRGELPRTAADVGFGFIAIGSLTIQQVVVSF